MNNEILHLHYEVEQRQFKKIWFDYLKKGLPNMIAFWGTAMLLSVFGIFFFEDNFLFVLLLIISVAVMVSQLLLNYQSFTRTARDNFAELTDDEKKVHLTFQNGADGFDCRNGKNFSHTAWESIKGATEFEDYFIFNRTGNIFYIPKSAFRDESEVKFLRYLISVNVNRNIKLLD